MTSAFNWKAEPSKLGGQLAREERRKPGSGGWRDTGNKMLGLSSKADELLRTSTMKRGVQ